MQAVLDTKKSEVLLLSRHAKERCLERNISGRMITEMFPVLLEFGNWNDREDRLTLNTDCKEFQLLVRELRLRLQKAQKVISSMKNKMVDLEVIEDNKNRFKELKKYLRKILRLEHKKNLTIVIKNNVIVTVYMKTEKNKNDTRNF